MRLIEQLEQYSNSDAYPFHMPGHKRQGFGFPNPYRIDITEIDGFDNLHHARGILKEAMERAGALFGSEKSYFLINGSSGGILSAMGAVTKRGDQILVSRACHKSVYHGMELRGLRPVYLYPDCTSFSCQGAVDPAKVREQLAQNPACRCVLLTSPTYDGILSDIAQIAQIAHEHGAVLIVDEAHGAHLGFHPYFPQSALKNGADLVIQSLHKTLPAFTQTAILHVGSFARIDRVRLEENLAIYQTSSPSYLLMGGIDACVGMLKEHGEEWFAAYAERLTAFYQRAEQLKNIRVMQKKDLTAQECFDWDPSKILIYVPAGTVTKQQEPVNGQWIMNWLRKEAGLELEMCSGQYALAMTSLCDTQEGLDRLERALSAMDNLFETQKEERGSFPMRELYGRMEKVMEPADAREARGAWVPYDQAAGMIAGEYVYLYPPGIPMLVPGERITEEFLENMELCTRYGMEVEGLSQAEQNRIKVVIP